MIHVSDNIVEEIKTGILCVWFFFFENRAFHEIMWENILERGRPQITIWRMRLPCRVINATNAYSEHAINIVSPLQQCLQEAPQY
jgi:hypothetical protein